MGVRYSTGCVDIYSDPACTREFSAPDLTERVPAGGAFRSWYILSQAGNQLVSRWDNGDVWGSDFRDASRGDLEPQGGADLPDVYLFCGHGRCQGNPTATNPDFVDTCSNVGKPNVVNLGNESRFGNGDGRLRFLFLDASCPMDLSSITNTWFSVFQGLHVATGHSGTPSADSLDSQTRPDQLGAHTAGKVPGFNWLQLSVGAAWMRVGIIDIESGCSAVVVAAGATREEAEDRRDHEGVQDNRPPPDNSWLAWRWVTRG